MKNYEIQFAEECKSAFEGLDWESMLYALYHKGAAHSLDGYCIKSEERLIMGIVVPDLECLTSCVDDYLSSKGKLGIIKVCIIEQGENLFTPSLCECGNDESLIVFAGHSGPLICGGCGMTKPNCCVPPTYDVDSNYYDLNRWNREATAWLDIEFGGGASEKVARFQLGDIKSDLSMEGMRLRSVIEERSGVNCFYFLNDLSEVVDGGGCRLELCPICGAEWLRSTPVAGEFDCMCVECRVVGKRRVSSA